MKKGTKLYSVFHEKCPHCQEGEFFEGKSVFNLRMVGKVYPRCKVCNNTFHKEPGFYYGALYVAYGLGVGLFVSVIGIMYGLMNDPEPLDYVIVIAILMVILGPKIYKLSRIIWANLFFPYTGLAEEKKTEEE